jgi:hypothetical protein
VPGVRVSSTAARGWQPLQLPQREVFGDNSDIGINVMCISPMLSMVLPTVAILAHKRLSLATRQGSQSGAIQCVVAWATLEFVQLRSSRSDDLKGDWSSE